ncbi:MAG: hypothetical protein M1820_007581 [Bogoriella megaspora]|nr:MAG: hypothetical protein M1820_007581 [Bogoriella megaspora]
MLDTPSSEPSSSNDGTLSLCDALANLTLTDNSSTDVLKGPSDGQVHEDKCTDLAIQAQEGEGFVILDMVASMQDTIQVLRCRNDGLEADVKDLKRSNNILQNSNLLLQAEVRQYETFFRIGMSKYKAIDLENRKLRCKNNRYRRELCSAADEFIAMHLGRSALGPYLRELFERQLVKKQTVIQELEGHLNAHRDLIENLDYGMAEIVSQLHSAEAKIQALESDNLGLRKKAAADALNAELDLADAESELADEKARADAAEEDNYTAYEELIVYEAEIRQLKADLEQCERDLTREQHPRRMRGKAMGYAAWKEEQEVS